MILKARKVLTGLAFLITFYLFAVTKGYNLGSFFSFSEESLWDTKMYVNILVSLFIYFILSKWPHSRILHFLRMLLLAFALYQLRFLYYKILLFFDDETSGKFLTWLYESTIFDFFNVLFLVSLLVIEFISLVSVFNSANGGGNFVENVKGKLK